ncbi:hypothetical protein [Actinotalea subterranea]|uniref:hypothetical protein n=1 Tax=Actinotalea subterranea TaxID=2607497 RepID=UPI0011EC9853|nr:hypothetical protein [Actinotalea subterranea]
MSEQRTLVVRQDSLSTMETAMTTAHDALVSQLADLLAAVDAEIVGWDPTTPSRIAELDYRRRLNAGIERLTAALEAIRVALADHREKARDIEVENVAILN